MTAASPGRVARKLQENRSIRSSRFDLNGLPSRSAMSPLKEVIWAPSGPLGPSLRRLTYVYPLYRPLFGALIRTELPWTRL